MIRRVRTTGFACGWRAIRSNRDAVGARVEVETGERTIVRYRKGGSSYAWRTTLGS